MVMFSPKLYVKKTEYEIMKKFKIFEVNVVILLTIKIKLFPKY